MCQQCTAHFLHSQSRDEVVTSIRSLQVESGVTCNPCVPHESVCERRLSRGLLLVGSAGISQLQFALFQPLYVVAELQCGPQFQTHILHDHVAPQEHQSFAINLLWKQIRGLVLEKQKRSVISLNNHAVIIFVGIFSSELGPNCVVFMLIKPISLLCLQPRKSAGCTRWKITTQVTLPSQSDTISVKGFRI